MNEITLSLALGGQKASRFGGSTQLVKGGCVLIDRFTQSSEKALRTDTNVA